MQSSIDSQQQHCIIGRRSKLRSMALSRSLKLALSFIFFSCYAPVTPSLASSDDFLQCLSETMPSKLFFTQSSPSFTSILVSSIRNPKFFMPATVRPFCIVTPTNASHVQAAVVCGRRHGVRLRVRSGGHDYEGLSYRSERAEELFAVVDLARLRSVRIDHGACASSSTPTACTAWVDSGATIGELYYAIAKASSGRLAFPAGLCPTIGVGGHLSGGGMGMLLRKYGLAIDNVMDAKMVDAEGRVLDKSSMGSDVFWAIRGGGVGGSFGVVLSWQVKLVPVPPTVATFSVRKSAAEGAAGILARWQELTDFLPEELFIRVLVQKQGANFQSLYLGTCAELLPLMRAAFPELGVNATHCKEMTWVQSVPYIYLGAASTAEDLLNRTTSLDTFSKATSDYVRQPIPESVWADIFTAWLAKPESGLMILDPFGGATGRVPESATPFPHRQGVLYNIQYMNFWGKEDGGAAQVKWIKEFYAFMEPYVSKDPREAYVNYRDLDLGQNVVLGDGVTSYEDGKVWGEKYYKGNFERLAMAKAEIDPDDYFRNEQSIPPLVCETKRMMRKAAHGHAETA